MLADVYSELAWLPQPPPEFREMCRDLARSNGDPGAEIARLAAHALSESQLRQLAAAIADLRNKDRSLSPLVAFRLGILGNASLDYLAPLLVASAARHGVALECVHTDFGQVAQEALIADSRINRAKPDAVLLAIDARGLPLRPGVDEATAIASVSDSVAFVRTLRHSLRALGNAISIVQTLAPMPETIFGNLDARLTGTPRGLDTAFNAALLKDLRGEQDIVFDVAALAQTVGLAAWHSPKQWNVARLPFDARFLPLYADHVGRILGALRGNSRKCLVLDLDDTVWGGVIGDDGIDHIVVGQGDATGEAYLSIQRTALALRERGVLLAVASKNDDAIARAPFRDHPEMLLREKHIAIFQANWRDKASNILAISQALSLGLDSLVFLDDNPAERELVRSNLWQVAVPELPDDPSLYSRYLLAGGYFESVGLSQEDVDRSALYEADARRVEIREQIVDVDAYLESLEMRIAFSPFDAPGRCRIAQLVNKSNQFNLTTRRYTEADIAAFEGDPSAFTLQVRLEDIFGDNGMISVVICRERSADDWEIDTWLMSCRVLGRRVEQAVLQEILSHAAKRGIRRVFGVYVPTDRNMLVCDHYERLGFTLIERDRDGKSQWVIETSPDSGSRSGGPASA